MLDDSRNFQQTPPQHLVSNDKIAAQQRLQPLPLPLNLDTRRFLVQSPKYRQRIHFPTTFLQQQQRQQQRQQQQQLMQQYRQNQLLKNSSQPPQSQLPQKPQQLQHDFRYKNEKLRDKLETKQQHQQQDQNGFPTNQQFSQQCPSYNNNSNNNNNPTNAISIDTSTRNNNINNNNIDDKNSNNSRQQQFQQQQQQQQLRQQKQQLFQKHNYADDESLLEYHYSLNCDPNVQQQHRERFLMKLQQRQLQQHQQKLQKQQQQLLQQQQQQQALLLKQKESISLQEELQKEHQQQQEILLKELRQKNLFGPKSHPYRHRQQQPQQQQQQQQQPQRPQQSPSYCAERGSPYSSVMVMLSSCQLFNEASKHPFTVHSPSPSSTSSSPSSIPNNSVGRNFKTPASALASSVVSGVGAGGTNKLRRSNSALSCSTTEDGDEDIDDQSLAVVGCQSNGGPDDSHECDDGEDGENSSRISLINFIDSDEQKILTENYWLKNGLLPDESLMLLDSHFEVINKVVAAYEKFLDCGTNTNLALEKELNNWNTRHKEPIQCSMSLPEWIQVKVIPVYTFASITYCKNLPGFTELNLADQATLIRLGQTQSRIMVAANHWFDPVKGDFIQFLSWRTKDLFKERLICYAKKIKNLKLDLIESALFNALVIVAADYPGLEDPDCINRMRQKLLLPFRAYTTAKYGTPNQRLELLFSHVPETRQLGFLHYKMTMKASLKAEEVEKNGDGCKMEGSGAGDHDDDRG
ncbi:hypothetical protein HELRODRAFT_172268 [Helobdella robusta]|uniref:NR LBD domain-containing protein n=1 Tax=Helobdella robusta TaxID=6412 RepID=T1F562_HELRO|nr:hypothetical protein HELRODRAFT_172268 [Helobdella robusta]ESO04601.1 hypothetical protein HELRODRAFT_172268 [Helobdella robusta]